MSDPVAIAMLVAVPPTILALASLIASIRNGRAINTIHVAINSRMDELLKQKGAASRAEGHEAGRKGDV